MPDQDMVRSQFGAQTNKKNEGEILNCYIFGAGASKSYAQSPTGLRMPIARDFFPTFDQLKITENPWVLVGNVINYVQEFYGIGPLNFHSFSEDIEVLHSAIYEKYLNAAQQKNIIDVTKYSGTNIQLAFLFVSVVNEIQNGPLSSVHSKFVSTLNSDDSIITFNWDTLLDRALHSTGKWNIDSGYGIRPRKVFRNSWLDPDNTNSSVELIKLHGSTNWLTSYPIWNKDHLSFTHLTGDDDIFAYEYTVDPYPCYDGRYMERYEPFSYGYYPPNLFVEAITAGKDRVFARYIQRNGFNRKGLASSQGIISMPLIITPTKEKDYGRFGSLFERLWEKAKGSIEKADRIFVIGYSFPATDTRTNRLFLEAFCKRKSIPDVIIINPNPDEIAEKFRKEFGIPENHLIVDKCFLDDSYDFTKFS